MPTAIDELLHLIDEAFDTKAWHGPTLRGALRGVPARQAAWRAAPAHNIWELTVHAAYWKYAVRRMLTGEKRGSFPLKGSNWFARPAGPSDDERAWRADIKLLVDEHRRLRAAVETLTPDRLSRPIGPKRYAAGFVVRGIAAHDLYHAGQISLLKPLYRNA